jgi:nitric oxide reductase NorD protein
MKPQPEDPLATLTIADPEMAASVAAGLKQKGIPIPLPELSRIVTEIIWGLTLERSFGQALASGYVSLLGEVPEAVIAQYRKTVREAGNEGPTLGRILAEHVPLVLKSKDPTLSNRFFKTVEILREKGMHLLHEPLCGLTRLLSGGEYDSGAAFLDLLCEVFSTRLTFNRARALSHLLPTAIAKLSPGKRSWQIQAVCRVARAACDLVDPFLAGIEKGLHLLSEKALDVFVTAGLEKYGRNKGLGKAFLSIESQVSRQRLNELQVCVPLSQVKEPLNRYLRARTGLNLTINSFSQLSAAAVGNAIPPMVCSDGRFIYLPGEISIFPTRAQNHSLYKLLAKLESGYYEFNTYAFDLEKLMARCGEWHPTPEAALELSDLERFFLSFPQPGLAQDLFTVFENARLRILMEKRYPGLVRQVAPILTAELKRFRESGKMPETGIALAAEIIFGPGSALGLGIAATIMDDIKAITDPTDDLIRNDPVAETSAQLVIGCFHDVSARVGFLPIPFGRRVRPDLVRATHPAEEQWATRIKAGLAAKGLKVYRSDLRRHLLQHNGQISPEDLARMLHKMPSAETHAFSASPGLQAVLSEIISDGWRNDLPEGPDADSPGSVYWYPEWDNGISDYLTHHVRVVEKEITGQTMSAYREALQLNRALVKKIRYAFELLKPEGLSLLRGWTEGDEFDYRALIEAAIDHQMGRIPSERLYIKRLKQQRDVAVLLLVDLSRSTGNLVAGTGKSILDVEREAIVLFCEALEVVGDTFSIAGFSGTGRLGVDYWNVKTFNEPMGDEIRRRIGAMAPQRSTRMGAAIRHALSRLETIPQKVRLLITLGDGFPNDTGYKGDHAISDTRRAVAEARSKGIHLRPITINPTADPQLDRMYGSFHHTVISDVRELPDKLWRIYNSLTR